MGVCWCCICCKTAATLFKLPCLQQSASNFNFQNRQNNQKGSGSMLSATNSCAVTTICVCLLQMHLKTISYCCYLLYKRHHYSYTNLKMSESSPTNPDGKFNKKYQWKPEDILNNPYRGSKGHACLILNREVRIPVHVVTELWQNASLRVCVDGGSNRWLQFLNLHKNLESILKSPDMITGDLDSITEETKQYFISKETRIVHTPDQNSTDFTKAVNIVKRILEEKNIQDIIVFHDSSGRLDQIMANINTLYKFEKELFNIYLLSCNSLTWLLKPGRHSITIPIYLVEQQRWCALIPVGKEADNVTTKGLKWDLSNHCLQFGGMVSTSNSYTSCNVEVETQTPLIWSMGIFDSSED